MIVVRWGMRRHKLFIGVVCAAVALAACKAKSARTELAPIWKELDSQVPRERILALASQIDAACGGARDELDTKLCASMREFARLKAEYLEKLPLCRKELDALNAVPEISRDQMRPGEVRVNTAAMSKMLELSACERRNGFGHIGPKMNELRPQIQQGLAGGPPGAPS